MKGRGSKDVATHTLPCDSSCEYYFEFGFSQPWTLIPTSFAVSAAFLFSFFFFLFSFSAFDTRSLSLSLSPPLSAASLSSRDRKSLADRVTLVCNMGQIQYCATRTKRNDGFKYASRLCLMAFEIIRRLRFWAPVGEIFVSWCYLIVSFNIKYLKYLTICSCLS